MQMPDTSQWLVDSTSETVLNASYLAAGLERTGARAALVLNETCK
jgi:hypothetical protein